MPAAAAALSLTKFGATDLSYLQPGVLSSCGGLDKLPSMADPSMRYNSLLRMNAMCGVPLAAVEAFDDFDSW